MSAKVLLLDIETAPILSYVWSIWEQNVGLNQIKTDWFILSWAAKWLGDPADKIMYQDQRKARNVENDKALLKGVWKLMDSADVLITQNGKQFDVKKLNARFILQGLKPTSSFKHIDTKQLAKKHFAFTSNRLEYLSEKINKKYKKLKHEKFPGFDMWSECLKGNQTAWEEMEKYNKYDILALEELYQNMAPWGTGVNFNLFDEEPANTCSCGCQKYVRNGYAYTAFGKYQRFCCSRCGRESRSKQNMLSIDKRRTLTNVG